MKTNQKILIIRFSSIGDIVLTTPLLRCIKEQADNTEIHFLVKKQFTSVLQNNPHIDKIYEYKGNLRNTIAELKAQNFSHIIDLQNNIRSNRITRRLKKSTFKVNKLNVEKWLFVQFKINKLPNKHIVDRYFDTLKTLKIENDLKGLDYYSEPEAIQIIQQLPKFTDNGYIVAVTGAAHKTKQIPDHIFTTILNEANFPVVFTGNSTDKTKANAIIETLQTQSFNACGICTLGETAEIIKNAKLIITPDTGAMHIAAAHNKPTISLWGNTVPEFGMYSYMPNNKSNYYIAEVANLKCRPCSKIGHKQCPKEHFNCMNNQDTKAIVNKIIEFWNLPHNKY